ncbi:MazG-like family protein [Streptomyces sp. NPDC050600]|uniref:MazG-like family protein n=1 Tax=Streptomyces sp. NPDC050600 TaxID=3157213 RepID=UPI00342721E6
MTLDPWGTIQALADTFDATDADKGMTREERWTLQVLKIGEEFGEAAQAVIGVRGTNPRKGTSHTWEDVHDEVADVIITGMVALARMRPDAASFLAGQLQAKSSKFLSARPAEQPDHPYETARMKAADALPEEA